MVQIRDVDSETVDVLKSRAAAKGMSLSDYLKREVERLATELPLEELLTRLRDSPRRDIGISGAELVRDGRVDLVGPDDDDSNSG